MLGHEDVQAWLDRYVEAWQSYDEAAIRALFTPDATYAFHPFDEPLHGAEAIAAAWLDERDEVGSWEAAYAPDLLEGNAAVATGETRYADGTVFSNLFQLEFDDEARCARFVEWYVPHPKE